jgi:hypothetical protein
MDTILATVTAVSLALAVSMGVLVARLLREERRRSDARVALLTELAAGQHTPSVEIKPARAPRPASRPVAAPRPAAALEDLELRPGNAGTVPSAGLFQSSEPERSAWPLRVAAAAAMIAVLGAAGVGWSAFRGDEAAASAHVPPAPIAAPIAAPPLELLSLAHQQQEGALTITGLVQNPRGASPLTRVQATVVAFDASGKLLATGRAPLDFTSLAPGDESPFMVRVAAEGATRYRVGFRGEDDQPLAHVDRRNPDSLARKEVP